MNTAKKTFTVISILAVVFGLLAAFLFYADCMLGYQTDIGHFDDTALTSATVCAFVAAPVLALAGSLFLVRRTSSVGMPAYSTFSTVASMLCGVAFAALGIIGGIFPLYRAISVIFSYDGVTFGAKVRGVIQYLKVSSQTVGIIAGFLALFCAVYFILYSGEKKTEKTRSGLSLVAVIWALVESLSIYFNKELTINSPIKSVILLGSVAVMMFLCEEVRFYIADQCTPVYGFLCVACASVGLAVYLPGTVIAAMEVIGQPTSFIFGSVEGIYRAIGLDLPHMAAGLAVTVFAISRIPGFIGTLGEYVPKKKDSDKSEKGIEVTVTDTPTAEAVEADTADATESTEAAELSEPTEQTEQSDLSEQSESTDSAEPADSAEAN